MTTNAEDLSPAEVRIRRRHSPRLRVTQFEYKGEVGARVHDRFGGATYSCIAKRNRLGRPDLAYCAIEVDEGLTLGDVRQLEPRQLAIIADEVAGAVAQWAERDRKANAELQERLRRGEQLGGTVGVGSYYVDFEGRDRDDDSPFTLTWFARLVTECRESGINVPKTVEALTGLRKSSTDRYIAKAVAAGLLTKQNPGRPSKSTSKETLDV